jgi:hypothetical protein
MVLHFQHKLVWWQAVVVCTRLTKWMRAIPAAPALALLQPLHAPAQPAAGDPVRDSASASLHVQANG